MFLTKAKCETVLSIIRICSAVPYAFITYIKVHYYRKHWNKPDFCNNWYYIFGYCIVQSIVSEFVNQNTFVFEKS